MERILTEKQENLIKTAQTVLRLNKKRKKNLLQKGDNLRFSGSKIKKHKQAKKCVVCNEIRALDYCHIIPIALIKIIDEDLKSLAHVEENSICLCKTHHWCFDHRLLTADELEYIYQEKIDFIKKVVLVFANLTFIIPEGKKAMQWQKNTVEQFNLWVDWVAKVFFIPKVKK